MKFTAALSVLALAVSAAASPTEGKRDYDIKGHKDHKGDWDNDYDFKGVRGHHHHDDDYYSKDYKYGHKGYSKHHDDYDFKGVRNYGSEYDYDNDYYGHGRHHHGGRRHHGNRYDDYDFDHYRKGGHRHHDDFRGRHGFGHDGRKGVNVCSAKSHKQVCCNGGLLGCTVQALGSKCSTSAYCCESGKAVGGLININALNCLKLL
ncbi:hypothetical protein OCS_05111 [Ophiocordyceps sinensis CO18]|uniref:Hydrophobin n=1 Tax=Ophiocordyceps sinensis (strain Co18 / CGMCC 3.14243) TaxID=911162 RepID=T5A9U9_OPHSC|nr:hypothetical protein OCS_05111 [Ophiocordyceps sinensis CO18]